MNKFLIYFSATVLFFSLSSCDELAQLLMVTFDDVEIEEIIDVSLNDINGVTSKSISLMSYNDTTSFLDSLILNISAADEGEDAQQKLAESLESISSINIDTLSIEILKTHNGITLPEDFEITTLTVTFSNEDSVIHRETHHNILPGELIISPVTAAELALISQTLQDNKDLKVIASGTVIGDNGIEDFALKTRVIADIETSMSSVFMAP